MRMPNLAGLAIALLLLSALFALLEWKFAALPRAPIWRRERRTDFFWWFLTPFFSRIAALGSLIALFLLGGRAGRPFAATWFRGLPLAAQWVVVLVGSDLIGYWCHRAFHHRPLWKIHAIHHSSQTVDWLAAARVHPLNELLTRTVQIVPFYLLGIDPRVVAAAVPLLTLYAIFLHANLRWDYGPLRTVIASPCFHRWHHTSEEEGLNRNFAGLFPWIDLLFGTFRMPAGAQPHVFGVSDPVPAGVLGQLFYPFEKKSSSGG